MNSGLPLQVCETGGPGRTRADTVPGDGGGLRGCRGSLAARVARSRTGYRPPYDGKGRGTRPHPPTHRTGVAASRAAMQHHGVGMGGLRPEAGDAKLVLRSLIDQS